MNCERLLLALFLTTCFIASRIVFVSSESKSSRCEDSVCMQQK